MKAMDFNQFVKKVTDLGYRVEHSTKHHTVVDDNGHRVSGFAVAHAKGSKSYVKANYVKSVLEAIAKDKEENQ